MILLGKSRTLEQARDSAAQATKASVGSSSYYAYTLAPRFWFHDPHSAIMSAPPQSVCVEIGSQVHNLAFGIEFLTLEHFHAGRLEPGE